jgi:hypothetical protein
MRGVQEVTMHLMHARLIESKTQSIELNPNANLNMKNKGEGRLIYFIFSSK